MVKLKATARYSDKMPSKKVGAPKKRAAAAGGAGASATDPDAYATMMERLYFKHYDEQIARSGPKTAILMQVGGFFEMYDYVDKATNTSRTNVQVLAELCGAAVEPRSSDEHRLRLFWGFPEASLLKFERILVMAGYTVRVVVQNKDATGEVASRTVDHVSSPGTFWDAEGGLAVRRDEQVMLGLYIETYMDMRRRQLHWYIASTAFDIMTGKATSVETDVILIDGKPVLDSLQPFWSMYPPAEVVVFWNTEVATVTPPSESEILSMFPGAAGGRRPPVHIRSMDYAKECGVAADRLRLAFLAEVFNTTCALSVCEYLGISMYHHARRSLFHLLQFVKDHNPSYLTALHEHTMWSPEDHVLLGNSALEQLAMIPSNSDRPHESLLHWLQHASTSMGRRSLRERCLKPIADIDELNLRQDRIAALRDDAVREPIVAILRGAYDLPRLYRKFQLGRGTTDDLLQLLITFEKAATLVKTTESTLYGVQEYADTYMSHITSVLNTWDAERIRRSKNQVEHSVAVGSTHPWKRGLFSDLDAMEDEWTAIEREMLDLRSKWETALEEFGCIAWTLRDDAPFTFTTTMRRATVLKTLAKKRMNMEITEVKRGSSSTVTLECAAVLAANAAALKLRATWRAAVMERWAAVWKEWMAAAIEDGMLEALPEWMGSLDAECAFAKLANIYGYTRPTYVESTTEAPAGLRVRDLRHPIIERVNATGSPYIPHSLSLGAFADDGPSARSGMLLYGVNASGKSSLGKAIGLSVLMAQCGIPVPAADMTLIPYNALFTRILGNDNLWAGMSSFVVEMTEFRSILRAAGPRTLVLGDELCSGTETASATSIVAAGVKTLAARGSHFFFATHLHELAEIPEIVGNTDIQFYHLTVHSDTAHHRLIYDRKLKKGTGSPMYGLEVCRGLDMDPEFLTSAFDFRKRLFDAGGARISAYNPDVVVQKCSVCGDRSGLETHHIVPQAAADKDGMIGAGLHKNDKSNLAVLCSACHDKHHSGLLEIEGWVDTTAGRVLKWSS